MVKYHDIYCVDRDDMSRIAWDIGCEFTPLYDV